MAQIDPREIYEVFFAWNESTNMTLLENGVRRGQVTISGGTGTDSETGVFSNTASVSGMLESLELAELPTSAAIFWKGVFELDREMQLQEGDFSIRMPRRETEAHFAITRSEEKDPKGNTPSDSEALPFDFRARALIKKKEIFQFDTAASKGSAIPLQMLPMASMLGLGALDPESLKFDAEARMGKFSFGEKELRAYLLMLTPKGKEGSVRIYFSEAGEPLRIETDLGFEAVSEILVPLKTYRPEEGERDS